MPSKVQKQTPEQAHVVIEITTQTSEVEEAKPVANEVKPVPVIKTKVKVPKTAYTSYISREFHKYKGKDMSNGTIFQKLAQALESVLPKAKAGFKI